MDREVRERHQKEKVTQKTYVDEKRKARTKTVKPGDQIMIQQKKGRWWRLRHKYYQTKCYIKKAVTDHLKYSCMTTEYLNITSIQFKTTSRTISSQLFNHFKDNFKDHSKATLLYSAWHYSTKVLFPANITSKCMQHEG